MPKRPSFSLDSTAENIGAALGQVAAKLDQWKADRASISADIQKVLGTAQGMLSDLGDAAMSGMRRGRRQAEFVTAPPSPKNKGGRRKGYKMSAATKAKLRAAWKRRKAAAVTVKAGASAAKAGAKAFVRGKKTAGGAGVGNG